MNSNRLRAFSRENFARDCDFDGVFSPRSDFRKNRDYVVAEYFDRARYDAVVEFVLARSLFRLLGVENDVSFFADFFSAVATPCSKRLGS